jgi:hypothetical protein
VVEYGRKTIVIAKEQHFHLVCRLLVELPISRIEKYEVLNLKMDICRSTSEWYFPGGKNPNPDRIIPTFAAMVDLAISK